VICQIKCVRIKPGNFRLCYRLSRRQFAASCSVTTIRSSQFVCRQRHHLWLQVYHIYHGW